MERLLTLVAGLVSACVALLLPAMAALAGYRSLASIVDTEAEIHARLATQLVNLNPELWQVQTARLHELLRQRPADATPEARAVLDLRGHIVEEVSDAPDAPLLERQRPVHDAGTVVATLRVQRSLRPLLLTTAAFGLLGLALGGGIFAVLRLMPLRALRRTQARLVHEATHDALTGLPNRLMFLSRLQEAMTRAQTTRRPLALLVLDLDRFKDINDSLGHAAGDDVLRHMAGVLTECMAAGTGPARRRFDRSFTVSRLGGDEFTAIVDSAGSVEDTSALAARILHRLAQPLHVGGRELVVTASIGIAMYPQDNTDLETLLRQADMAMYRAKDLGRNTWHFFNDELNRAIQRRIAMEQDLRGALERGEFELHYQPKAELAGGRITGVEALLRWRRPSEGLVPPDRFIGALEESGLIVPVGEWVLATACAQLVAWDRAGLPPLAMAVNLSARQFRELDLPERIERILQVHGLAPQRLELELTESLLMEDSEQSRAVLLGLDRVGVRSAIDDFGTGHSSLAYLKRFRVDTLKIDRSFVRDLPHDADNGAITSAVAALAHSLGLTVVCEGVETPDQLAYLRSVGCDEVQGFLLARPMPADALADWLRRHEAGDALLTAWHRAAEAAPRLTLLRGAAASEGGTALPAAAGSAPPVPR